ncbi:MAG: hypothetical protein VYA34_13835 [Myxococcota bacterium]|nr:hypothetical protein [Myxococcota bacterium]
MILTIFWFLEVRYVVATITNERTDSTMPKYWNETHTQFWALLLSEVVRIDVVRLP